MKHLTIFILLISFCGGIFSQELDSLKTIMNNNHQQNFPADNDDNQPKPPVYVDDEGDEVNVTVLNKEIVKVIDNSDSTYVKVGTKGNIQVNEQRDSTMIKVGNKEIKIVERGGDTDVSMRRIDDRPHYNPRFRGHWAGFEWGINNMLDNDFTLSREGDNQFLDLNTGRSWAINLNFAQYSLGFGTNHFGAVIGLGLEFNNYFFDGDNSIIEEADYIVEVDLSDTNVVKSKLTATYLRIPFILEVQFPNVVRARRMFISAGLITGIKLGSHTKVVYKDENGKNKDKNRDDFNMSPFRYGLTARVGFGNVSVFGDYYFTPVFVKDKGPQLQPFTLGLAFNF